jgi:hypothetical protein
MTLVWGLSWKDLDSLTAARLIPPGAKQRPVQMIVSLALAAALLCLWCLLHVLDHGLGFQICIFA